MQIKKIDHFVITARDISATVKFYEMLGFISKNQGNRYELYGGDFKINVHQLGKELSPHARNVQIGSSDFCLEVEGSLEDICNGLIQSGIDIEEGIVERHGVGGRMNSIYLRDPDGNLVELSSYKKGKGE